MCIRDSHESDEVFFNGCDPCDNTGEPTLSAPNAVEAQLNLNLPPCPCPSGRALVGFENIECINLELPQNTVEDCHLVEDNCACYNSDQLNCFYCKLESAISNGDYNDYQPRGKCLTSIDLFTNVTPPGTTIMLTMSLCYGTPVCTLFEDPPLPPKPPIGSKE